MAAGIPNSKLLVVEGANHSVHHEKNELVISEIRQFFSANP
jgi:pimeloyl-ACP methyl ester carboxylesterase